MAKLIHEFLEAVSERQGRSTAIISGDVSITFSGLHERSVRIASAYLQVGVKRGDRVLIFLENSIEFVGALYGAWLAGAVAVPVNPGTKADKLRYLLRDSEPRVVVAQGALARTLHQALADQDLSVALFWVGAKGVGGLGLGFAEETLPDEYGAALPFVSPRMIDQDLAAIIYTSGSTGEPKGVMLTHHNLCNTSWAISSYLENRPDDTILCLLPLTFDYGLYQVLTGIRIGFKVILERSFAYPRYIFSRMEAFGVTGLPGVPTLFAGLLQHAPFAEWDLSRLRYVTNTGAPLPPVHLQALAAALPRARIYSMYGLTECTRVSWLDPARIHDKAASVGKPMPNCEVLVLDEHGRRAIAGEVGELVIRGSNLMPGYWRKPEATARCIREGGWVGDRMLFTGDLFRMDEEGFLYFLGRRDDIFKSRGQKISPKEVEAVICECPGVAEAAIVGVPDPVDGMAVKALVVPARGSQLTENQIRLHCRAKLESHLVPSQVEFVGALPRSANGKVQKRELSEAPERRAVR